MSIRWRLRTIGLAFTTQAYRVRRFERDVKRVLENGRRAT